MVDAGCVVFANTLFTNDGCGINGSGIDGALCFGGVFAVVNACVGGRLVTTPPAPSILSSKACIT